MLVKLNIAYPFVNVRSLLLLSLWSHCGWKVCLQHMANHLLSTEFVIMRHIGRLKQRHLAGAVEIVCNVQALPLVHFVIALNDCISTSLEIREYVTGPLQECLQDFTNNIIQ